MPNAKGESIREHSIRYSASEGFMSMKSDHQSEIFLKNFVCRVPRGAHTTPDESKTGCSEPPEQPAFSTNFAMPRSFPGTLAKERKPDIIHADR
jgi:hypothetical protein